MMDVVNLKRINTEDLWRNFTRSIDDSLSIEKDGLKLKSEPVYEYGKVVIEGENLKISDIAVDECDIIYIVNEERNSILKYEKNRYQEIGCEPGILPVQLNKPQGIGIDKDTLYVADETEHGSCRLIALARYNLQIRWILCKGPAGEPINECTDLIVSPGGEIYILEDGKRVIKINKAGEVVGSIGHGLLSHSSDIALHKNGNLYVLDEKGIYIFEPNKDHDDPPDPDITLIGAADFSGLSVDSKGQIFLGNSYASAKPEKTIYKIEQLDETPAQNGETSKPISPTPIWSYRDTTKRLINDSKGNLYVINDAGAGYPNKLTFLKYTKKNRANKQKNYSGCYISKKIDSQKLGTRWHRILIEGKFEEETHVEFLYCASDNDKYLDEIEESDKIKDKEKEPWWYKGLLDNSSIQGKNRRDALFQEGTPAENKDETENKNIELEKKYAQGRYLWFKIILIGTDTLSPVIDSLTLFFPRITYIKYLPEVYQEDGISRDFLERFLPIFETIFDEIDFDIDRLTRILDSMGTPNDFLAWLSSWLSVSSDENWSERKKRKLLQMAVSLYKKRGTREGLEEIIKLYIEDMPDSEDEEPYPFIVEYFQLHQRCSEKEIKPSGDEEKKKSLYFPPPDAMVDSGDCSLKRIPLADILFGTDPFCFCVLLHNVGKDALESVKRIIEEWKPAHTCYGLKRLEPWFYLDMHTYLGVNTKLTKQRLVLGEASVIGRDTVLDDTEDSGQVERHSRLGIDTKLT